MIQITPQMRIVVAVEAQDCRTGIDGFARLCLDVLDADPFGGTLVVFRSRGGTAIKCVVYDSQGFWLAQKRLSTGRFRWWPASATPGAPLEAHQRQRLIMGGDPAARDAAPVGRRVRSGERDRRGACVLSAAAAVRSRRGVPASPSRPPDHARRSRHDLRVARDPGGPESPRAVVRRL